MSPVVLRSEPVNTLMVPFTCMKGEEGDDHGLIKSSSEVLCLSSLFQTI